MKPHNTRSHNSRALKRHYQRSEERGRLRLERDHILPPTLKPLQQAYTDGSCPPKGLLGGWGFCVVRKGVIVHDASGGSRQTTTNRMELQAIMEVIKWVITQPGRLKTLVFSDSQYSVRAITEWMWEWEARGWRESGTKVYLDYRDTKYMVKNKDIFEEIIGLLRENPGIFGFTWIKGHSGNQFNEYADMLATSATKAVRMQLIMEGL